jgi:nucleoside-diphosphate-sugar epimerase/putative sterol carrier protein
VPAAPKLKVAVTGGSGQLGTLVVRRLLGDRSVGEVVSLDLRPPAVAGAKLRVVYADVREPDFERHLQGCDALVHLAFVVTGFLPREQFDAINVGGSENVFQAAAKAGVKQILYASSVAAYGALPGHPVPLLEDSPRRLQEDFPYSAAKFRVEQFLDLFERTHPEIAIVRMRPTILVGDVMDHGLGDALRRRVLIDAGGQKLPIVWDEDVADAFVLALKKQARGAFNLSAEDFLTAAELANATGLRLVRIPELVRRTLARSVPVLSRLGVKRLPDPAWLEAKEGRLEPSSEKAKRELGWKPRHPNSVSVLKRQLDGQTGPTDRRIALFLRLVNLAGKAARIPEEGKRISARIHLQLTGRGGGDFAVVMDRGRVSVAPGIPRPPTSVVTLKASTFLELLAGTTDLTTCQLTGRMRVEGEGLQGMFLGGMVGIFRATTERKGAVGFATRKLRDWFKQGAAT